jgi:hypothetical protein
MGKLSKPRAEKWADEICTQLGKSVESIITAGRLLTQAKADLPHGEWLRIFNDELVPFDARTAQRLMAIAANPELSNAAHASLLPPSWTSLYELTKVEPDTLHNALRDRVITPDMKRSDVAALLPAKPRAERPAATVIDVQPVQSSAPVSGDETFESVEEFIVSKFEVIAEEKRPHFIDFLQRLLSRLAVKLPVHAL